MTTAIAAVRASNVGVGQPPRLVLLSSVSVGLVGAGLAAIALGISGRLLPHDEEFLRLSVEELCAYNDGRIVHFMIHDRISFGGAVACVGLLYGWMTRELIRRDAAWAWWGLVLSAAVGFGSFFAYLGYGYLDLWHAVATSALFVIFVLGLFEAGNVRPRRPSIREIMKSGATIRWSSGTGIGRACLVAAAIGLIGAGATILAIGATDVFVSQDLRYMGLSVTQLNAISPRLVPLIAHDRASFGGAVCSCGIALFACIWSGRPSRGQWNLLATVGVIGFGTAIGVHPAVGYNDVIHLAPAIVGAIVYACGLGLTYKSVADAR